MCSVPANSCSVDDLPVITENIQKGFQETKKTINKWITDFQKKLDGDEDDDPVPQPGPSQPRRQDFGPSQSNQLHGIRKSAETTRRSGERDRYDADPQVLSDDFGHRLELRDEEGLYSAFLPDSPSSPNSSRSFSIVALFAAPPSPDLSPCAPVENSSERISNYTSTSHKRAVSVATSYSCMVEKFKQQAKEDMLNGNKQQPQNGHPDLSRIPTFSDLPQPPPGLTTSPPPLPTIVVTDSLHPPQAGPSRANGNR
jgi:hypothetical protein